MGADSGAHRIRPLQVRDCTNWESLALTAVEKLKPPSNLEPMENASASAQWFAAEVDKERLGELGFRFEIGGVHLSKTMMLRELAALLASAGQGPGRDAVDLVLQQNVLGKATGSARKLALQRLNTLYGVSTGFPVGRALHALWPRDEAGRPLLALLCALAREPLLRESAALIFAAAPGARVRWPDFAAHFEALYPQRYSPKMLKSLSQNCASTWTQSGHLVGPVRKQRSRAIPSAVATAYAAMLGSMAGFGGGALLTSPWFQVLDRPQSDLLAFLHQADGAGLLRLRAGGGVVEINVRERMAEALGVPELANGR